MMFIEPPVYLAALLDDFRLAGGRLVVRALQEARQLAALPEAVVMNCTGLGSKELFGDEELLPDKGQLTVLLPQPEVDYAMVMNDEVYMFPRQDGILLGGTHERGVSTLEPNVEAQRRIVAEHQRIFDRMR
jgi:glycine/D-amino acid oxidase-like deaminating enzyme